MKIESQLSQRKKTYFKVRFGSAAVRLAYLYILGTAVEHLVSSASETTGVLLFIWVGPNSNLSSAHKSHKISASETGLNVSWLLRYVATIQRIIGPARELCCL